MSRLPVVGGDEWVWGEILNDYLEQTHNPDGTIKNNAVISGMIAASAVTSTKIANSSIDVNKLKTDSSPTNGQVLTVDDTEESGIKWATASGSSSFTSESGWFYASTLATATGTFRLYNDSGSTRTIQQVRATVGTTSAGASVIVDVNKGGRPYSPLRATDLQ